MILDTQRWWLFGVTSLLLVTYFLFNRPRFEHLVVLGLLTGLLVVTPASRSLGIALIPAAAFGLAYDALHLFQPRSYETVVIEPIWRLEAALFGWLGDATQPLGPLDVFRDHHATGVDALGAIVYSVHLVPAFAFGLIVWWAAYRDANDEQFERLSKFWWGFLALNLLAFSVHVLMPVAPPWYVYEFGFIPPGEPIVGHPAGLARVDVLLGYGHFEGVYGNAKYVFGALPSLHVAVPAWVALRSRRTWVSGAMWALTGLMAFYAVYFAHHYIVDLIAGVSLAVGVHHLLDRTRAGEFVVRLGAALRRLLSGRVTVELPSGEAP